MLDQAESILCLQTIINYFSLSLSIYIYICETPNTPNGITYKVDVRGGQCCEVMSRESL